MNAIVRIDKISWVLSCLK